MQLQKFLAPACLFPARASAAVIALSVVLTGCATAPEDLRTPRAVTCINVPTPLSYTALVGIFDYLWIVRLERGPYISEKEDEEGTYYRAPPGGLYLQRPDQLDKPASVITRYRRDGGLWIPRNPEISPRVYQYFSMSDAPAEIPAENADCASVNYLRDPVTSKLSVAAFTTGGAVGGAVGRFAASGSQMSYGQAAVGGAIGGAIVAGIINMGVGKIIPAPPITDATFIANLRELASQATPLIELPPRAPTVPAPTSSEATK